MEGNELGIPPDLSDRSHRGSVSSTGARSLHVLVYLINDTAVQLTLDNLTTVSASELGRIVREVLQLPEIAQDVFSLWLISPLLELQLKPKHQPYKLCRQWQDLLFRFTDCSGDSIMADEPSLQFRRNVFFQKKKELQIEDENILRLLYDEAKYNILEGRYPCDVEDCEKLGALTCRVELGAFDQEMHNTTYFSAKLDSFLPAHICKKGHGGFLSAFRNRGPKHPTYEEDLLKAYKEVTDDSACEESEAVKKHLRDYLNKCHTLMYYGSAFFSGEIDKPAQGFLHKGGRKSVSVAISLEGVCIMDRKEKHVLLSLRFSELSWDHTYPEEEDETQILWLEFDGDDEGTKVNKLLKIYSKQAEVMSGLIEYCVELSSSTETSLQENPNTVTSSAQPRLADKRGRLRRQNSVVCNRLAHLSTIDYIDDGKEIKRIKPRRTASFFTRQISTNPATYSAVQLAENLEQG
ncbi:FERM domain-containing protein 8 [Protopterus annectens]|uniref:FERM domain-containing protein 8 n=1 Tax=Protopterus annectens TaxID=7888 RepID=UPI001CFA22CF|nr:FERM domain-containing protein 8 [Protopterus annectens]